MTTRGWWDETWRTTAESPTEWEYRPTEESRDTLWMKDWWKHFVKPKHVDRATKLFKDWDFD